MSFRYGYTASMEGLATQDDDGCPVAGTLTSFECDYQPTPGLTIKTSGTLIDIAYKLFVSPNNDIEFKRGAEITCAGVKGILVEPFRTRLNTELWVK